jgi:hypothetical protein
MTTLIVEENQILENDHKIADLSVFLKRLPSKTEITLILKSHDVLYHLCPIRKAVPFLKSAEYSPDYWVGEKRLPKGQTFIGGIFPSPFMKITIKNIAEHFFPIKGIFLWADLITQAYGPFDPGWTFIWHNHHLLICQDGILRISRSCYLPLVQELPAILRYLKRLGYEEEMPITLFKSSIFSEPLPSFVHPEIRIPRDLSPQGLILQIPQLAALRRLSSWSRKIHILAYGIALLNILGAAYFSWQIKVGSATEITLRQQIADLPIKDPVDEAKMQAFKAYCFLSKNRPDPLPLIRQLIPLIRGKAVATHLQWTAGSLRLILHLELEPSTIGQELFLSVRSELRDHKLTWQQQEEEPQKGILTIEQQALEKENS